MKKVLSTVVFAAMFSLGNLAYAEIIENSSPICISCQGGQINLQGAAATVGGTVQKFVAPAAGEYVAVDQFSVSLEEGQSLIDITIGTDGTFAGMASARHLSYSGAEQQFSTMNGGMYELGTASGTSAGSNALLLSVPGDTSN